MFARFPRNTPEPNQRCSQTTPAQVGAEIRMSHICRSSAAASCTALANALVSSAAGRARLLAAGIANRAHRLLLLL